MLGTGSWHAPRMEELQTNVSATNHPQPQTIQTSSLVLTLASSVENLGGDVDFVVDDGLKELATSQRPGKKRRKKWMQRLKEAAQRALARTSGIPSGLSRKSRKRKRKGMEKDMKLALQMQSQETVQGATRSACVVRATAPEGNHAGSDGAVLNASSAVQHLIGSCLHQLTTTYGVALNRGIIGESLGVRQARIVSADWRQTSRSDTSLLPHVGAMCAVLQTSTGLDRVLREHLELSMLMVWVANSPPASSQVRDHCFGTCGLGVHWWNEAKRATATRHKQENIRLYHAWRFEGARVVWWQWVPILPRVWAEVISHVEVQNIVADIVSDCENITTGGHIQRLHESVPFTSGYMADAGDRGTKAHFDQSTVGDSWVLIFSCLDVGASGGEFWVVDPTVDKAVVVHAGGGTSIILCKAGWFKHGARPVVGGSRVVTVLWNNPRIRDDRIANPRPLLFEDTSSSWPPRSMIASFKESPLRNGLPPKALHKDDLCSWLNQER